MYSFDAVSIVTEFEDTFQAALAKHMVYQVFNILPAEQRIACGPHGKPYLSDYPNVHFKLSHSGHFVACAICGRTVGLDIQKLRPYARMWRDVSAP